MALSQNTTGEQEEYHDRYWINYNLFRIPNNSNTATGKRRWCDYFIIIFILLLTPPTILYHIIHETQTSIDDARERRWFQIVVTVSFTNYFLLLILMVHFEYIIVPAFQFPSFAHHYWFFSPGCWIFGSRFVVACACVGTFRSASTVGVVLVLVR